MNLEEAKKEFGTVEYFSQEEGCKEVIITHTPYIDTRIFGYKSINGYWARGEDEQGDEYEIYWSIDHEDTDDEWDGVNWDDYVVTKL